MSFSQRYARIGRMHAATSIPEGEVFSRVLAAIRTIRSMPKGDVQAVRSNWPKEFEFHGEAIKLLVFEGNLADSKFKRLMAKDFDDIHLGPPAGDEADRPRDPKPSRAQVSDAMVAGAWFSCVAIIPENVSEFENRIELYRLGKRKSAQVDDQRILSWLAFGWSIQSIAQHRDIETDEHQVERRINEISRNLWRIANGTARLCDIEERQRNRERAKAGNAFSRERA